MDFHAGDGVLLEPHGRDKKTVNHVLCPQMQVYAVANRNNHCRRENVVASCRIARVNTKRIAFVRLGKLLCVDSTKYAVGSWIAEIPLELRSSDLDFNLSSLL